MIRLAAIYFAIVFAAGFVLGTLRVMFLVPALGTRYAELIEIPWMLLVVWLAGRWIGRQTKSRDQAVRVGVLALAMLLGAEVGLGVLLLGKSPVQALFEKDPISGTAYYLSLLVFAVMPAVSSQTGSGHPA